MPYLCVSLGGSLNFFSMSNSDMVMVQKIFRILKLAQITWSFIERVESQVKILWVAIFQKSYKTSIF